ncbi:HAMP domain-containing sensor histidine kinase [Nannocystis sp. ILAH1]|uniref:sensor histidine kinase n=1 Tax=unclassified Nannocystis TaxID=2627009 RepID=UPI00226D74A7|nr:MULTISPECIES: HAMP domain-containing sensor histidine kinase [unclassified Nannocystis]MCY0994183.1 HAMP domain-containing sensor histidine kinase [Nannocystis sp. ILAH1]MCY1063963.1 HAMP domain-containing sensor histidine kinase [Nannocystis sp. RBIL2]
MREPAALLPDVARRIADALAGLGALDAVVAVPPHAAVVVATGAAAGLLAHFPDDPRRHPLARCLAGAVVDEEAERIGEDGRVTRFRARAVPVRDGDGAILAAVAVFAELTTERRRLTAAELLDDAGRVLLESLELARVAQLGAELLVPRLGDVCLVSLLENEDELRLLGLAHADPAQLAHERPLRDLFPLQDLAWDVLQDSRARLVDDLGPLDPPLHALGLRTAILAPLLARGRALGVVRLLAARRLDDDDLELVRRVGDRLALALDNAREHAEALRASQAREDVLTVVSHDLRNPLSAITLGATVLVKKLRDAEENVAVIQRSAARIERLTENLLDLAGAQAGRPTVLEREVADAREILEDALALQKPLADKKSVRLVARLRMAQAPLFCDRTRIAQVFGNLLDNAIKFSASGQEVVVEGDLVDGQVRFSVRDQGPGIEEADLPHIFEPFWSTVRGGKKGLGLGLSIARSIVDAHDGRMSVASDHAGAVFTFTLPLAHGAPGEDAPVDES